MRRGEVTLGPPNVPDGSSELTHYAIRGSGSGSSPISVVPRAVLNNTAPDIAKQQLQTAAHGGYIGFGYGRCRTAIKVLYPVVDLTRLPADLLIPGFVGRGPIDAIESVQKDNETLPTGITYTAYTGAAGQVADPSLVAAWSAQTKTFADTLDGMAHIVLRLNPGPDNRLGNFTVVARHLKVYDPRDELQSLDDPTTWVWSQNPVLALAHFLSTKGYGPEETLDWNSVSTCADVADQSLFRFDGITTVETRRQVGIFFDQPQDVDAIEETLRSYAGVFVDRGSGSSVVLIPDAPADSTFAFTNATPSNYLADSIEMTKRGRANSPTVVTVRYTDTVQTPWATQEVTIKAVGVEESTDAWIETSIDWPGCQSASMAYREAVRRLNEFQLADMSVRLIATDEALAVRRGDVVTVTDSEGFTAKPFRVSDIVATSPGRWQVSLTEYQDAVYTDIIYNGPVIPDTSLPSPSRVPRISTVTLAEEVFQTLAAGTYSSRIVATWSALMTWPFTYGYRVKILDGSYQVIDDTTLTGANSTEFRTAALQEGFGYTVFVYVVSSTGAMGAAAAAYLVVQGSKLPPSDVPSVSGVLNTLGQIVLTWGAATDIDLTGYEVRVGSTIDTWGTATTQTIRTDAATLTATVTGLVPDTYRCFVKARDSIRSADFPYGQYSTNDVYADFIVPVFTILGQGREIPIDAGVSLNFEYIEREGQPSKAVTAIADPFGTRFPSALSAYGSPISTYNGSSSSTIIRTGWYDLGQLLTGVFNAEWDATTTAPGGLQFGLSTTGLSADVGFGTVGTPLQGTARYVYIGSSGFVPVYIQSNSPPVLKIAVSEQMAANTIRLNDKAYDSPGRDATAAEALTALGLPTIASAWTAATPVVSAGSGTITTATAALRYLAFGKLIIFSMVVTVTTNGTGGLSVIVTGLPFTALSTSYVGAGRCTTGTGFDLTWQMLSSTSLAILNYDNTYPAADGHVLTISGVLEAA